MYRYPFSKEVMTEKSEASIIFLLLNKNLFIFKQKHHLLVYLYTGKKCKKR